MEAPREGRQGEAPWRTMSGEELEKQYSPSRWAVRRGPEETLRTYSEMGIEATVDQMVDQTARSLAFLQQRFPSNKGMYLCGHSAGAHLAAMMLPGNWTELGVTPNLKAFFLVSGVYDLEPIVLTSVNAALGMTPEDARRNSPQRLLEAEAAAQPGGPAGPVLVVVGQHDSPEFRRQSREFCQTLSRGGWRASLEDLPDVDHFEIVWKLAEPDHVLTQIILKTIFQEF